MAITCGIDWAESHHDVALMDDRGSIVARARIATGLSGQAIGVDFEFAHVVAQRVLLLTQPALLFVARVRRGALHRLHALGDLLLTRLEIPRALGQLLHAAIEFLGPRAFEIARCPVQLFQRRVTLRR